VVAELSSNVERVNISTDGGQATQDGWGGGHSGAPAISADGRFVAFDSPARNLVAGDMNEDWDVFVHDMQTGRTERVSTGNKGQEGDRGSWMPVLSPDGRFILFSSHATNFVDDDKNKNRDVFLVDLQTKQLERVSVSTEGKEGPSSSWMPSVSSDGRFVAFYSYSDALIPSDKNGFGDILLCDRQQNTTTLISQGFNGQAADGESACPVITADGRYIAYSSFASNLVERDKNNGSDIFLYDRTTGRTELVSIAADGTQGNHSSYAPSISDDGRYVVFYSYASNLVAGDKNNEPDVFVRDRLANKTEMVSITSTRGQANGMSVQPAISANGRFVAFASLASNMVPGDLNGAFDVFVHDRQKHATICVSITPAGKTGNERSLQPAINADGSKVAFESFADNLVAGDRNGQADVFVRDLKKGKTLRVSVASDGSEALGLTAASGSPQATADGRYVVFDSRANTLVLNDTLSANPGAAKAGLFARKAMEELARPIKGKVENWSDIFLHDRTTKETKRVSVNSDGVQANWDSWFPSISGDGSIVSFTTRASNLVPEDVNDRRDVYAYDIKARKPELISVADDGSLGNDDSWYSSVSWDGRYVAFFSHASNLVAGDNNKKADVFIRDRVARKTIPVSVNAKGEWGNNHSVRPKMTPDGRYVTFHSMATNLVEGGTNGKAHIFVFDRTSNVIECISASGNRDSWCPSISADGRYVTYYSYASNLVPNDSNNDADVIVYDRITKKTMCVSVSTGGRIGNRTSWHPSISGDGRFVVFESLASNVVSGDANGASDVFVHDMKTRKTMRVSVNAKGEEGNAGSRQPFITANGKWIFYESFANNLVQGDTNGEVDVLVVTNPLLSK
jgi:Tol biopolymer transport system component